MLEPCYRKSSLSRFLRSLRFTFFFLLLCVVGVLELWETSYERGPGSLDGGVALFFRLGELKVAACQKELRAMRAGLCQRRMGR